MAVNTSSIFYQIGSTIKSKLNNLLSRYPYASDLQNSVTMGTIANHLTSHGTSDLLIVGLNSTSTYTEVEYIVNGSAPQPISVTFSAGKITVLTDATATVSDVVSYINDPINLFNPEFSASLASGTGTDLITGTASSAFSAGSDVSIRGSVNVNKNVSVTGNITTNGNQVITGDLTVNGTTTTLSTTNSSISDNVIQLSDGAGANYANDAGLYFNRGATFDDKVIIWDASDSQFTMGSPDAAEDATSTIYTVTPGDLKVNTVFVYDDSTTSYKEVGDIEDFNAGLNN